MSTAQQDPATGASSPRRPLTAGQIYGYGMGDFALNLFWSGSAFFLLYWYTDVAGLPNRVAGFLFFVGSVWDAVTDPAMGIVAERTRTRWGRYRPYLLLGSIPLAASFVLLLWVPPWQGAALMTTLIVAHLAFRTAYTVVAVPFCALSARISHDSQERIRLSGARMIGAYGAALSISALGFPIVHWLGRGDEQVGFTWLAAIAGVVAIVILALCFRWTWEPDMRAGSGTPEEPKIGIAEVARMVRANRAFLLVFAAILMFSAASVMIGKNLIYFVKYGLGEHARQHVVIAINGTFNLLMIPVWTTVARRLGKRRTWLLASALAVAGALVLYASPVTTLWPFVFHLLSITLGTSAIGVLFWSMLPDTVEYGEWRTGIRSEAIVFGFTTLAQKVSIGIAGWTLGAMLDWTGYVAGAEQSAETVAGIKLIMTALPALLITASAALIWFYPIDAALHNRIVAELDARASAPPLVDQSVDGAATTSSS